MLLEWIESLITPCSRVVRELGYGTELVAIGARHRRCRAAWADHLRHSRRAVEAAIGRAARRRTAVVLGSGRLLDVPLAALAAAFERVILVDAVHPLPSRWRARRYRNVELLEADITGVITALRTLKQGDALPRPVPFGLLNEPEIDLVVSLNLLSQLGVVPVEWLEAHRPDLPAVAVEAFGASLTRAHLDDLARCRAAVCLIADVEQQYVDAAGKVLDRQSTIYGIEPPPAAEEWIWRIAPAPESDPLISEQRRVIVVRDPGRSPA